MKIGLQVSSLEAYLQTPHAVQETFQKIRDIGYKYVQIQYIGNDVSAESVNESLRKSNLICMGTQDDFYYDQEEFLNSIDKIIARNLLWQAKYVCVAVVISQNENEIKKLSTKLNDMSHKLNNNGLILEIHPLFPSLISLGTTTPLDMLWKQIDDAILLQPDFFHTFMANANVADIMSKYHKRIVEAHLKDFRILDGGINMIPSDSFDDLKYCHFTPLGQGIIPWKDVIEECKKYNMEYYWVEQEKWDKDAFDCMKESFDYLISCGLNA